MALAVYRYPHLDEQLWNGEHDFGSDDIYCALVGSGYTPSDAHNYWEDVVANKLANGNGYATNGVLLGPKAVDYIEDTAADAWVVATTYVLGDVVRPTTPNDHVYVDVNPGASHGSTEPTWPTESRKTVVDNAAIWAESGRAYTKISCANPQWTTATFTMRYAVIYNRTPGTNATRGLIALVDPGESKSVSAGTFELDVSANGLLRQFSGFSF